VADNIWLARQKKTAQVGTITISTYDAATLYRAHVPTTAGPFAEGSLGGTTTTVATSLTTNWNAQTGGEFDGITASSAAAVVTLTADNAGDPFTAVAAVSGGAGTIGAYTAVTANTSPNDINDTVNWSAGSVPAATEDVYIDAGDTDHSLKWNLGALSAVTLTSLNFFGTFTGDVGLPRKNETGEHDEYLAEYLAISATTVNVNPYDGSGSGRILLNTGSVATTVNVYNTGSPTDTDLGAFIWKGTSASNAMRVEDGSVDVAPYGGETANLSGGLTINGGSVRCSSGVTLSGVTQNEGSLDTSSALAGTTTQNGGTHVHRIGTVTALVLNSGVFGIKSKAAMTVTDLTIGPSGVLDLTDAIGLVTVTNTAVLRPGATIIDPFNRLATSFVYSVTGGPGSVNVVRGPGAATITVA
jgi:hypothetical protein